MDIERMKKAFYGPVASITTPFTRSGEVDFDALGKMVDFYVTAGSPTMLLTYGDSMYTILTDQEIAEITKFVIVQTAGRSTVTACGGWALNKTLEFADSCREWGADAFMVRPPEWAGSCNPETLEVYFTASAKRFPIVLMTSLLGGPLPLHMIDKLLDSGADIVGIKDDVCAYYGRQLAALIDGRCAFLSGGRKTHHFDQHFYGEVNGYLSVYLRFLPAVSRLYHNAIINKDYERAALVIKTFDLPFFDELAAGIGLHFSAVIHAVMEVYGICQRWQRLPYPSATDAQMEIIRDFMKRMEKALQGFED